MEDDIWRSKFYIGTLLTTIIVTMSYEVKQNFIVTAPLILVILSFILSICSANAIVDVMLKYQLGRKLIKGKTWIEGYWYLSTHENKNCPINVSSPGIGYISYEGNQYNLRTVVYRRIVDNMHKGRFSLSKFVTVRSFDLKYCNVFIFTEGEIEYNGMVTGEFFSDGTSYYPNKFEGYIILSNEGENRRQSGSKIPAKIVKKLKKEDPQFWMDTYLQKDPEFWISIIK